MLQRQTADEALPERESHLHSLIRSSSDFTLVLDGNGKATYESPSTEAILGYPSGYFIAKSPFSLVHPDDFDYLLKDADGIFRFVRDGAAAEFRFRKADGAWAHLGVLGRNLLNDPVIQGFVARFHDVTELRMVEEALRTSEERYRLLTDNLRDPVWIVDMDLNLTYVSPSVSRVLGYMPQEILALDIAELFTPSSWEWLTTVLKEELAGEALRRNTAVESRIAEVQMRLKDGSVRWFEFNMSFVRNPDGKITSILGTSRDVNERKRIEEALRESEARFRVLAEATFEGIALSQEGTLLDTNPQLARMLGCEPSELIGKTLLSLIAPVDRRAVEMRSAFEDESAYENRMLRKDGSVINVETRERFFTYRGHRVLVTAIHDITTHKRAQEDLKKSEERLRQAEKMEVLGKLAGGVAHDLNNVLGVLVGYSELFLLKIPPDDPLRKYALNIMKSSEKGAAIIQDLLTMARRGVAVAEVVSLNRVVTEYFESPEYEKMKAYHQHVTFRIDLDDDLLHMKGSPVHLGKTLMNLVSNAAEAVPGEGEMTVRTRNCHLDQPIRGYDGLKEGDYVVLEVTDNGKGIAKDDLTKVFEPFYTKKVMGRSGTGLGLAIVWGTVKDHNGYIDLQSEEGEGTTFTLYFPVTREAPAAVVEALPLTRYTGNGETILVVDDVAEQRELAVNMLGSLGYRVTAVSGGEEAVERLKEEKADLVVLDMIMDPGIDGLETYRRMLAINPEQKAVIVSGFSETEAVRELQELGAGAYVKKPYILGKIGAVVKEALEKQL